ncbi:MAG: ABC transporter ATP-binding protein [Spirochaetales bacterium]|nr:ABC transporter ATP-binding protein [Spirochaetales bacterium]
MNILELNKVNLELDGNKILNDLSLNFEEGLVHAVIGPNGAGKSSLAMTIMGLSGYEHFGGDIRYKNDSIKGMPVDERARKGITLAWQEPARFEGIGVAAYLGAGNPKASFEEIDEALNLVGLAPSLYRSRKVDKTLSGGERKRVELASIALMQPRIVLMDEPDSGVDIEAVDYIFKVIEQLKSRGTTIILITHSPEVLKHSDHCYLLCHGQLVEEGETEKMLPYFSNKCLSCTHQNFPVPGEFMSMKGVE